METDFQRRRIGLLEQRVQRLTQNPAPTVPQYDLRAPPPPTVGYYIAANGHGTTAPATGTSYTATIPITTAVTVGSTLFIVALFGSTSGNVGGWIPNGTPTDSKGGSWSAPVSGGTIIGQGNEQAPPTIAVEGFSYRAVMSGADLQVGDTVTCQWQTSGAYTTALKYSMFIVLEYANLDFTTMVSQNRSGVNFTNWDGYPDNSPNANKLSWATDLYLSPNNPSPDAAAYMITLSGIYPAKTTYTPLESASSVKTQLNDTASLVVTEMVSVAASQVVDPGGTWDSGGSALVANYQFMHKTA